MHIAKSFTPLGYFLMIVYASEKLLSATRSRKNINRKLFNLIRSDYFKMKPKPVLEFACDFFKSDYSNQLRNCKTNVVCVGCENDSVVPAESCKKLAKEVLPNGKYVQIANATHLSVAEVPQQVAEVFLL